MNKLQKIVNFFPLVHRTNESKSSPLGIPMSLPEQKVDMRVSVSMITGKTNQIHALVEVMPMGLFTPDFFVESNVNITQPEFESKPCVTICDIKVLHTHKENKKRNVMFRIVKALVKGKTEEDVILVDVNATINFEGKMRVCLYNNKKNSIESVTGNFKGTINSMTFTGRIIN